MTIQNITKLAVAALIGGAALLPAIAQADTINGRLNDQHSRIEQGLHNGTLTRREASRLQNQDRSIRRQENTDRFFQGGRLTAGQRGRLNARLNRDSGAIYNHKHDIGSH